MKRGAWTSLRGAVGMIPFLLLAPLFGLRFALHLLVEFPKLLYVVGLLGCLLLFGLELAASNPPFEPDTDLARLSNRLHTATVAIEGPGKKTTKLIPFGPFFQSTKLPGWNYVGPISARFKVPKKRKQWAFAATGSDNYTHQTCIWAHPPRSGVLTIRFPAVTGNRFFGWVHLMRSGAKDAHVKVKFKEGVKTLGSINVRGKPGEVWEFDHEIEGDQPLVVEIRAARQAKNHVCFEGVVQ